ncbi:MAG: acyl carrier protein [Spirochaetales bacterium]|nr:acyl carrier protein [Spirochaetales bacterium]
MTREEIFERLKETLVSVFEIEESDIVPEARLGDDLDLDSIDAIDLVVKMKEYTPEGKPSIDASLFKSVKTIQDVIDAIASVWA